MCAVMLQFQHKKQKLRKHKINKTKNQMKWQTYQFPLEIESSSRKQSAIFDSINQNETKRTHERTKKMIKIKKGRKTNITKELSQKKETRNG